MQQRTDTCLFGDAQGALHGAGRLRLDRQVRGAAAAADGPAAAVEQRQLYLELLAHLRPFVSGVGATGLAPSDTQQGMDK